MNPIDSASAFRTRWMVLAVMISHFISAFAALGMPPFFALILSKSLHSDAIYLAGWFYIVPTLFAALSSPWWGKLSDRFGKKRLLIRAQLGLSASFLLAGFASNSYVFLFALVLQGLLGGTFAASNTYLSSILSGSALVRGLTAMQWSARAALVAAPICMGLWVNTESPILLYRYLAWLPLLGAVCIAFLPQGNASAVQKSTEKTAATAPEITARQIYVFQFIFVFATVITFPYFIPQVQAQFPSLAANWAGLLFGLPHLVYLMLALPMTRWLGKRYLLVNLGIAFVLLLASLIGQAQQTGIEWLVIWRLLMGIGMTISFIVLHTMIASTIKHHSAGETFGWFESSSKWGAVGAGLCAGVVSAQFGLYSPLWVGAAAISISICYIAAVKTNQLRLNSLRNTAKENA
ncbi:MAG: MFS transporter [Methylotenera sp.]|nr:MAG: MFS transporter [Methylotenera sp.]